MKSIHLQTVDSTNTYLKDNYSKLENYTFVSTNEQTAGRGRNKRVWKSENGKNLLFSLLILDKDLINKFKSVSIISAYSLSKCLYDLGIKNVKIKWPNDVYVNDLKIAGVLLEAITLEKTECLIVGIGLNVNQTKFDGDYLVKPTSIKCLLNIDIDINLLKETIYDTLTSDLEKLKEGKDFYPLISNIDYLRDKEVFVDINDSKEKVKVVGIDFDYSLKVTLDGSEINLESDEVSFH